ncbi:MAG TPA: pantetheine-phosphate adenylyltransferase [Ilumatobacteraceae bacterium]|jgi:pantetheine-phosphate adenylyltransferase|nr:pantetheine-phosphate adenylyltransferase [Ilumatobacteraceae bacterium]
MASNAGSSAITVLYPGSFDPFHLGHLDVIEQSVELFGNVVVGVMHNPSKPSGMFSLDERVEMIRISAAHLGPVEVVTFAGLAVNAARDASAAFIVKGLRTGGDFEVEQQMAHTNYAVSGVRTVYLPCKPALVSISSRFIREIAQYGGDVSALVPAPVAAQLSRVHPPRTAN